MKVAVRIIELKEVEIIVMALKAEATQKPNEIIYAGRERFTYGEFVAMLNSKKLQKNHQKLVKRFLQSARKMFKENPTYRLKMMRLAGVEE